MGWYAHHVFPWVLDRLMSRDVLTDQRRIVLREAAGAVLEIGFGTGLNLPYYPSSIERLSVLDPNEGMRRRAAPRIAASLINVEYLDMIGDFELPAPDAAFDTVVSTWTLCSVRDPARTLSEIHRVLRPGGRFLYIEHGLSPDSKVAAWQRRMNWASKRVGCGCRLDRDIGDLIEASPLKAACCDEFYMAKTLSLGGYTYRGMARSEAVIAP